jgi:hypothetical protein
MQATGRRALRWFAGSFGRRFRRCGKRPPDLSFSPRVTGYMRPVANPRRPKCETCPWRQATGSTPAASASSSPAGGELRTEACSRWMVSSSFHDRASSAKPIAARFLRAAWSPPSPPSGDGLRRRAAAHDCASLRHERTLASASASLSGDGRDRCQSSWPFAGPQPRSVSWTWRPAPPGSVLSNAP